VCVLLCAVSVGGMQSEVVEDDEFGWDELEVEVDESGSTLGPDGQFKVEFVNNYKHDVDLHWDDGHFGKVVGSRLSTGESVKISTFAGHLFHWTEHGTSRPISHRMKMNVAIRKLELTEAEVKEAKKIKCMDRYPSFCTQMAGRGECDVAPGWMIVHCPMSCGKCDLQDPKLRCPREKLPMLQEPVWKSGDLNKLFEHIMENFAEYNVKALSSPPGPWILEFENFVKPEEMARLIELNSEKFARSTDQGSINEFGEMQKVVSKSRTSLNSWCDHECERDTLVQDVYDRIVNVTQVPKVNFESFQILQYKKGQFYRTHHDDSGGSKDASGPRILTFFLYLSDVEEGGETDFPRVGVRAKPKAGSAILWPSMSNDEPTKWDPRTHHQAMPVIKGVKYAANAWIHLYNYRVPNLWGCTGSFS